MSGLARSVSRWCPPADPSSAVAVVHSHEVARRGSRASTGQPVRVNDPMPDQTPAARVARWFQPSPAELAGLAILVSGAIVASAMLWFQAAQRPSELTSGAASIGVGVGEDGTPDGPAPGVTDDDLAVGGDGQAHGSDHGSDPWAGGVPGGSEAAATGPSADPDVTVHVTGAVATPGLVILPDGGRVGDAVEAAGGLVPGAQDERINLARPVVDGEHVHVPREGEEPPPATNDLAGAAGDGSGAPEATGVTPDGRVDINRAGPAELETLPGVGPARAEAIVAHREQNGPFAVPGDLRAVSGIGEVIFQRLAELVTVG
jgi:competence protein ComEA